MVGREKANQAYPRGSSQRLKEDRINQLPDPLICHILSHLPPKDCVKTSVLSTRWRGLWLLVPSLELVCWDVPNFNALMSFGDRFFDSNRVSCIDNLKLVINHGSHIRVDVASNPKSWIDAAVKRKIQHLYLRVGVKLPISLYTCETLVSLILYQVELPNAEFVSLPCLKTMHLRMFWYPNEATFERLVSSCPVLEELEIYGRVDSNVKVFRVFSRSLKKLSIELVFSLCDSGSGIVIDAPRLHFLNIDDNLPESFMITNMDSNVKLVLRILEWCEASCLSSQRNRLRSFLPRVSKVRDMIIHLDTLQLLCEYSKLELLPQFGYMSRLHVTLESSHLKWLPSFLESFPNLKSLILVSYDDSEKGMNHFSFSHVPQCLLSSLEFVDFKVRIWGLAAEMELVKCFLVNSAILKKLTLPLYYDAIQIQDDFVKKLLKIPRRSTECEVVFL